MWEKQLLMGHDKGEAQGALEHRAGTSPGLGGQNTLLRGKHLHIRTSGVMGVGQRSGSEREGDSENVTGLG